MGGAGVKEGDESGVALAGGGVDELEAGGGEAAELGGEVVDGETDVMEAFAASVQETLDGAGGGGGEWGEELEVGWGPRNDADADGVGGAIGRGAGLGVEETGEGVGGGGVADGEPNVVNSEYHG